MTDRNPTLYHATSSYYSMVARYALTLAEIPFESRVMDIHRKREQLEPWYILINPAMTVPALVASSEVYRSSLEILRYAQSSEPGRWYESCARDDQLANIQALLQAHDSFAVERLTFNALMHKLPPLRLLFPRLLRKVCKQLQSELDCNQDNHEAIRHKLAINKQRLAYFEEPLTARQAQQIALAKQLVARFPEKPAGLWLFGDVPSCADVVLVVFLARLNSIGLNNTDLVPAALRDWFKQKAQTPAFGQADIWANFHLWRLFTHR